MSEILKQKPILNFMKIWRQFAKQPSGKLPEENTADILSQRICL